VNIFEFREREERRKKRFWLTLFYGPFLYVFALLVSMKPGGGSFCFFGIICAGESDVVWWRGFVLYLYILFIVLAVIYGYKGIERMARRQHHLRFFKLIFILLPVLSAVVTVWKTPFLEGKHYTFVSFITLVSIGALAMIEFHKK